MKRVWTIAALGCFAVLPARAASPDPRTLDVPAAELSKARELVRQLASEVYKEREQAQKDLAKMGRLARPVLSEALAKDPNPEVRARAARLLPRAESLDLQARIDTFLADTESKFHHDMPSWDLFRTEAATRTPASEKAARDLYVEAIKTPANLELLASLPLGTEPAGRATADRRLSLFLQQNPNAFGRFIPGGNTLPRQPTLADVAILLFAEIAIDEKDIPRSGPFSYVSASQFVQIAAAIQAVNKPDGTPQAAAYRQVFIRWLDTRTSPDTLTNVVWVASQFQQLKESTALLERVVRTDGVSGYSKAQGMIYLLQRGKDGLPAIKTQLKNDTNLGNGRIQIAKDVTIDTQVRDVAMALLLHSEGQDLKKFGFEFQPGFNIDNVRTTYWGYGFKSDADRTAAYNKYLAYEAGKKTAPKKDAKTEVAPPPAPIPAKK
ncbi:MAG TPA: hypothetical protein VGI99_10845 [Gemmataceae bacterium]